MQLEKSKKRIAKKVKMGFQGYPTLGITYFGPNDGLATEVVLEFVSEEGAEPQTEKFTTESDIRENEAIQSAIVKTMERSGAQSVTLREGVVCTGKT
ncbi:MAG: hypothetical protein V7713_11250 [Marinobacter sp.]|uniref:hypothetical protein n=1 Tax=Marinobacter sp. AC-23 TaxID=1879031 RepID=UPI0008DD6EA3|nr:hypothetical protein [Marinobacter sp. AC-23]OHY81119.1 hypothetical protein BCA33_12555 [Marinobacter sp. AC-23]